MKNCFIAVLNTDNRIIRVPVDKIVIYYDYYIYVKDYSGIKTNLTAKEVDELINSIKDCQVKVADEYKEMEN